MIFFNYFWYFRCHCQNGNCNYRLWRALSNFTINVRINHLVVVSKNCHFFCFALYFVPFLECHLWRCVFHSCFGRLLVVIFCRWSLKSSMILNSTRHSQFSSDCHFVACSNDNKNKWWRRRQRPTRPTNKTKKLEIQLTAANEREANVWQFSFHVFDCLASIFI